MIMITHEQLVDTITNDVNTCIREKGVRETLKEYGVALAGVKKETRSRIIELCVAKELDRCFS